MSQSSYGGIPPQAPRTMDCPEARVALGVYVLGAIEPAERALVDAHLTTCRDCRDELAGLAGLPALLSRVSNEEAIALAVVDEPFPAGRPGDFPEPPRELLATVLDLTSARRRRRRRLQAAAGIAAALVIGAGIFGGVGLGSSPAHPPTAAIGPQYVGPPNGAWLTAAGQSGTMTATVGYRPMGWGTQLAVKVTGVPVGTDCQLWVVDAAGNRMLAGGWQTDNDEGTVWYPGSAALVSKNVAAFQVTLAHGKAIEVKA